MTIWILAFVLVLVTASAGYVQGAIRVGFSLLGIVVGMLLAMPLAPWVIALLPFVGITSAWVQAFLGPIVAFILVGIGFKLLGGAVHRKIEYHYKYRVSDGHRALWERMNRRLGAALGTIGGAIYFVLVCLLVSILGYFTIQVGGAESNSSTLRFVTRMAEDVRETHMDQVVGGLNPAPESYYDLCDFLGFLVQNRDVFRRIRTYPPIRAQGTEQFLDDDLDRKQPLPLRSIVDDERYFRLLATERDPAVIMEDPHTETLITNAAARAFFQGLDVKDLMTYLKTGKSPKYADERLIGVWVYDYPASLMATKRERPDMSASEMILYEREMSERYTNATLVATLDNVISIKQGPRLEGTPVPGVSNAPPRVSYTGRWRKTGPNYALELRPRGGTARADTSEAFVQRVPSGRPGVEIDRVTFRLDRKTVCFDRTPE